MEYLNKRKFSIKICFVIITLGFFLVIASGTSDGQAKCTIPVVLRGYWFSLENGHQTNTDLYANELQRNSDQGFYCEDIKEEFRDNFTIVFSHPADGCYYCMRYLVRSANVLEKIETGCVNLQSGVTPTVANVCANLNPDQQLITLFSQNDVPVNCRSSLEGVWQFAYQNQFQFTGECSHPEAQISSCPKTDSIVNQKIDITYKACPDMLGTFNESVQYSCLGDWFVGNNHFFAVGNRKATRKDNSYRCFLRDRDDNQNIGVSITAECNTLKTVEESPTRLRLNPAMTMEGSVMEPGCRLPQNFSGNWINTANLDADIVINDTHIIETLYFDQDHYRRITYICKEQRDNHYMMARLSGGSCHTDYVCFDFLPRHHNIIRYHKGVAVIKDDFNTVCSGASFQNREKGKYSLFLSKNPVPVRCPVAGRFNFTQKGDVLLETKPVLGITLSPRPNIYCKQNVSDFSVCDTDQTAMLIDETYCLSVDHLGRPINIYGDPDYRLQCIGHWKENLKSYLITYDTLSPISKYNCWVYQRADLNRILMSQAIGTFCDLAQDATSWNYTQGAAVALEMQEYERGGSHCPLHFDDGANPWTDEETD